jgi:hypothetical protein
MKVIIFVTVILLLSLLVGCSNGMIASYKAWGTDANITCYSMGKLIYQGVSHGVVNRRDDGDIYFEDKSTSRLIEISDSSCVVEHL